jgi:AhpD family alkylhydroperoxidase
MAVPIRYVTRSDIMFDEKTKELIAIGASITANCQPCLDYHIAEARAQGAEGGEILAAIEVGKQVRRGAGLKMDRHVAGLTGGAVPAAAGDDCSANAKAPPNHNRLLDGIEAPVLLMQGNPRQVVTANKRALDLFGKELRQVEAHRGGQVFDCLHSFSAAGCGLDANCEHCAIKGAIVDTFTTGASHEAVTATLPVRKAGVAGYRALQVSTEKIGDLALVRIERYEDTDALASAST